MLAGQGRWSKVFQFAFTVVFFNENIIASQCCISFVVQESESVIQVCMFVFMYLFIYIYILLYTHTHTHTHI